MTLLLGKSEAMMGFFDTSDAQDAMGGPIRRVADAARYIPINSGLSSELCVKEFFRRRWTRLRRGQTDESEVERDESDSGNNGHEKVRFKEMPRASRPWFIFRPRCTLSSIHRVESDLPGADLHIEFVTLQRKRIRRTQ